MEKVVPWDHKFAAGQDQRTVAPSSPGLQAARTRLGNGLPTALPAAQRSWGRGEAKKRLFSPKEKPGAAPGRASVAMAVPLRKGPYSITLSVCTR